MKTGSDVWLAKLVQRIKAELDSVEAKRTADMAGVNKKIDAVQHTLDVRTATAYVIQDDYIDHNGTHWWFRIWDTGHAELWCRCTLNSSTAMSSEFIPGATENSFVLEYPIALRSWPMVFVTHHRQSTETFVSGVVAGFDDVEILTYSKESGHKTEAFAVHIIGSVFLEDTSDGPMWTP